MIAASANREAAARVLWLSIDVVPHRLRADTAPTLGVPPGMPDTTREGCET